MSLCHSCSSCTCNGWGKKNPSLSSRGVGGSRSLGSQPLCYCGEKSVLRTAKTVKNRGKQFWGCSKYKSGNEDGGCNYFKWWTEDGIEEIGNSENCEGRGEIMVKTEESDGDRKTIINLEKSVAIFEKWMKVLIEMVIFVCVVNVIVLSVLIKNA
ncbi:AP endonuclease 2 [Vigna unguiculata]|uniref:AP endonuclease 2 n=1 Tax=Vigna unguiculata TaxID=3917 RepID=A0A4D6KQ77_VIGUN|nr:AP endonuclease 2 [Vigna unguiculata]